MGSHRVALHLGEIAQDDRWEKQGSGRMMALHCRSWTGPVRFSLGKRVALPLFFERGVIEIRPRKVLLWEEGDTSREPQVWQLEEVDR